MDLDVAILGGGLVGSLLGGLLSKRYSVTLFEKRQDPRLTSTQEGRSINLIITSRGLRALNRLGLDEAAKDIAVPVYGRMIHQSDEQVVFQPYGVKASECNYSISRTEINKLLLRHAEKSGVNIKFEHQFESFEANGNRIRLYAQESGSQTHKCKLVIGADGAGSALRHSLLNMNIRSEFEPLSHSYKELYIPTEKAKEFQLNHTALHIWPRGHHMMMALPNLDGSFTVTLYLPNQGDLSFESLKDKDQLQHYFQKFFPDAIPLMPKLFEDFANNPVGQLGTVRAAPWHYQGQCALIGDAAHAIVPFFGQGMNCGFEDCIELEACLAKYPNQEAALQAYYEARKPNADAIAQMSLENFEEMSSSVGMPKFQLRKLIEQELESLCPDQFKSRYGRVVFTLEPYEQVLRKGVIQSRILDQLSSTIDDISQLDRQRATKLIKGQIALG